MAVWGSLTNEHPRLISFRTDWLDLLAVQVTLKSLLQHHSSKTSILLHSAFFILQLSHPYTTTRKTILLDRQTFVGKVMSLFFNTLFNGSYRHILLKLFCFNNRVDNSILSFYTLHEVLTASVLGWSVICLLQWITFCQNSPLRPIHLGWPYIAWLMASLSLARPFATKRQ